MLQYEFFRSTVNTTTNSAEKVASKVKDLVIHKIEDISKAPEGVTDFDKVNWNDPFQVSHYAMDIFNYLKSREVCKDTYSVYILVRRILRLSLR